MKENSNLKTKVTSRVEKRALAWGLVLTLIFTNVDYVNASNKADVGIMELSAVEYAGGNDSSNDGEDILPEEAGTIDGSDVSGNEVKEILYSGMVGAITWEIASDKVLYISGQDLTDFGEGHESYPWHGYKEYFNKAVVDAEFVQNTSYWFDGCDNLQEVDFSQFDSSDVGDVSAMFRGCSGLTKLDLSDFDMYGVNDFSEMFKGCSNLSEVIVDFYHDNYLQCDMSGMFYGCAKLTRINMGNFCTIRVTNTDEMFAGCTNLEYLDISALNALNLKSAVGMFQGCNKLTKMKTMYNLDMSVELPKSMYDIYGQEYTTLPSYGCDLYEAADFGEMQGVKWFLSEEGTLIICGTDTSDIATDSTTYPWHNFKDKYTKVVVTAKGLKSTAYWFDGCDNISEIDMGFCYDGYDVTEAKAMFRGCSNLTKLTVPYMWEFAVTDYSSMFEGCVKLVELDTSFLDVSNATNLSNMFKGCSSLVTIDLLDFNTSNVTIMDGMFADCSSMIELDVSGLDTSKVTSADQMFTNCNGLSRIKVFQNLQSKILLPMEMFDADGNTYTEFPLGVTEDSWLYAKSLYSGEIDGLKWNITTNGMLLITGEGASENAIVRDVYPWHEYKSDFNRVIVTATKVKSTAYWFDGCSNIIDFDVSAFDTSEVVDMRCMFRGCSSLEKVYIDRFDTRKVTNFSGMFEGCNSMTELFCGAWFTTENATDLSRMFKDCVLFDFNNFRWKSTPKLMNLSSMYENCYNLIGFSFEGHDTSNVVDMSNMFSGCSILNYVYKLDSIDTSNVTDMSNMFRNCSGLSKLDFENGQIDKVTSMKGMVSGCKNMKEIRMPANLQLDVELPRTIMYDFSGAEHKGYFPKGLSKAEWLYAINPGRDDKLRITEIVPQTYTGKAIKPEVTVYDGVLQLVENVDYTLAYQNNKNVQNKGETAVVVKGKGNYSNQHIVNFEIVEKNIEDEDVIIDEIVLPFKKKKMQLPKPVVRYNGQKLVKGRDYEVRYPDVEDYVSYGGEVPPNWLSGTYRIWIEGIGNFNGYRTVYFTITDGPLMKNAKISRISNQTYTGSAIEPELKVTCKGKTLVKDVDYIVEYRDNVEQGKATVVITGIGNYAGTKTAAFQIVGQPISKAIVSGLEDKIYSGQAQTQNIKVELDGKILMPEIDYIIQYKQNINAGKAEVNIVGKGAYSGGIKKKFKILPYDLVADNQKLFKGVTENLVVPYEKGGSKPELALTFDGIDMVVKKDYLVSYSNNKKIASAKDVKSPMLKIKGRGNFKGAITIPFTITMKDLQDTQDSVSMVVPDVVSSDKSGKYISKPVLTDTNGKKLVAGTDYENIVYTLDDGTVLDKKSVVEAGKIVTVSVTGKGGYTGTLQMNYKITKYSIKTSKVTINPQSYTGKAITLNSEAVKVETGDGFLEYGVDYEIVEGSYQNNVKRGIASVKIKGIGDYSGEKIVKFKIVAKDVDRFWDFI